MLQKKSRSFNVGMYTVYADLFSMTYCVTVYPIANGPLTSYIGEKNFIITFFIGKARLVTMDYHFSLSL